MSRYLRMLPMLLILLLGAQDVALAGGGGSGGSKMGRNEKLTDAQVAECAENPEELKSMTKGRSKNVKADAAARVIDQIATDEGVDSPKIKSTLYIASELGVTDQRLGTMMKNSPNKNQILAIIKDEFGDQRAQSYANGSGAVLIEVPGTGNDQSSGEDDSTDAGRQNQGSGDTGQTGQNTPPPPVQDDPEPPAEEPVPPPQPPVGQPYAGQQLL